MPSARAKMGAVRRRITKRQKKARVAKGMFDTAATVATFVGGQAKKGQTAWEDYEAGYKELGGEGFERPKFGQKGYFKGPEGDIRIGDTMYDRAKIQKAGSFLGSDASAILSDEQRQQYLGRTVPGRLAPGLGTAPATQPHMVAPPTTMSAPTIADFRNPSKSLQQWSVGGIGAQDYLKPSKVTSTPHMFPVGQDEPIQESESGGVDPKPRGRGAGQWLRDFGRDYFTPGKGVAVDQAGELITNEQRYPGGYMSAFAKGGDFITNGPQEILVGDNPGGRERVTITPLDSEDYKPKGYYGEARNWLETLYENNKLRKKY